MPRLHFVKKARKDNPAVKAGESYYWWKHNFGPKRYSKTKPRRSQLTNSSYLATVYDLQDDLPDEIDNSAVQDLIQQLEELRDETESSLDNMPEHLQDSSSSGQVLQERLNLLEEAIDELNCLDFEDKEPDELEEIQQSVSDILCNLG